ncbi:MAG: DUF4139 domain-containing protein [Deltaproteobacteria bacterium]|nr:DUF4139 domain-containing protein [Deltaproteobacteria bacterium]
MHRFLVAFTLATATFASVATLGACGGGQRFRYPTADAPLRLDRVVLYRNGVGYFERSGRIEGDLLTLKVRKDQVNDLLKSLTIVDRSTGRAVSVSMPLDPQTWANAALATLRPGQGSLAEVLDSLRGSLVTLTTTDGEARGRVAMVEQLVDAPDPNKPGAVPKIDHRVSLLDGDTLRIVKLSTVRGLQFADGDLAMQFNRTLDASAGEGMFQQVAVSIRLAGASSHDLRVSYVVAAPMWKPTYRVVLPDGGKGKALLQAWAVVDNTSGEEWKDVKLALTSGAPIAFRYDLHTPREIERPDLTDRGVQRQAEAMVGETTYTPPPAAVASAPSPMPPPKTAPRAPTRRPSPGGGAAATERAGKAYDGDDEYGGEDGIYATGEEDAPAIDAEGLRRSTQAQARAQTVSGQTRFELDQRVTVPEGTSTMVAIINADVDGEETFLYRPGGGGAGYELNPYRVVRFANSTPFVLEPGPIGIYSGGSFVGEGLSETVGAATSATVPFAVETGVSVASTTGMDADEMHLVRMSRGVLEVEQFSRRTTTYTVRAMTDDDGFTVLIRHSRAGGNYELKDRPAGTEDLPDAYLVRLAIPKGQREGVIKVVEQTPSRSTISIWNAPAVDLLEKLLVDASLGDDTKKKLRPIIDRRRALAKIEEQIAALTEQRNKLDQRAAELRQNLEAIAKNPKAAEAAQVRAYDRPMQLGDSSWAR